MGNGDNAHEMTNELSHLPVLLCDFEEHERQLGAVERTLKEVCSPATMGYT